MAKANNTAPKYDHFVYNMSDGSSVQRESSDYSDNTDKKEPNRLWTREEAIEKAKAKVCKCPAKEYLVFKLVGRATLPAEFIES